MSCIFPSHTENAVKIGNYDLSQKGLRLVPLLDIYS